MNIDDKIKEYSNQYTIVGEVNLDDWHTHDYENAQEWLNNQIQALHKPAFLDNERILFIQKSGDVYVKGHNLGLIAKNLVVSLYDNDISNCFAIYLCRNHDLQENVKYLQALNDDDENEIEIFIDPEHHEENTKIDTFPYSAKDNYRYGSLDPLKIDLSSLTNKETKLLTESKTFCMYPWVHLHAWPTGQAFPCCMSEFDGQVGDMKQQTMEEIWNGNEMKQLRVNMLNEQPSSACVRCYEQEQSGFFSGRLSANKHHGHHVGKINYTDPDGTLGNFNLTYWDIRFSNLCNLSCRSCGHIFSSNWYKDQVALAGPKYAENNTALNYAGRWETDMWEQLEPHLDYVEQIYFAGGEPLMMEEHYLILEELERRGRFDVRLIYNTNFTHVKLKDRLVFDYWKKFDSVAVGASLDAMGPRAEYIRKGTKWNVVEENRRKMMEICPDVDFYISPTLSILNALHLPDFHRDWVDKGFIRPQDLNVNILQNPDHYRIDIANEEMKREIETKIVNHLDWLRPFDKLNRATQGFESALNFLWAHDNSHMQLDFLVKTQKLDNIRGEYIGDYLPELEPLYENTP